MDRPDVTVILCTYNRAQLLRDVLNSIAGQETDDLFSYEVLVVDDGSTDNTAHVVQEMAAHADVPLRYVPENGAGLTNAMNRGVAEARGKWVVFFDDDEIAEPDWLRQLLIVARDLDGVCVAGNRRLRFLEGNSPDLGPVARGLLGEQLYPGRSGPLKGRLVPAGGTFLMARRLFDELGPFVAPLARYGHDTGGTDTDYMLRIRQAGHQLWTAPLAAVYHLTPPYRTTYPFLRWISMRQGSFYAQMDCADKGKGATLLLLIARLGQALLVNLPLLVVALLRRDRPERTDRFLLLVRMWAYLRQYLCITMPRFFDRQALIEALDLRRRHGDFGAAEGPGATPATAGRDGTKAGKK